MVFSVTRQEDDCDRAALSHPRRIAERAVRRDEELRLFVLEFKRITECRPPDDPDDGRRHGVRTRSHRAIKFPSRRSSVRATRTGLDRAIMTGRPIAPQM